MKSPHKKEFSGGRLILLAPNDAFVPRRFENTQSSSTLHSELLAGVQRLRGRLYLADGAIGAHQLTSDGRHHIAGDEQAWHVVALDENGEVAGCSRYLAHPNTIPFHRLTVRHAAVAASQQWGTAFRGAVCHDIERARRRGVSYVEVGGWALTPKLRRTREALRVALATYGLARALGGCIGITTATRRHCSSDILRRIGGQPLQMNQVELPAYFDPQYGCEMEVLRFDSIQASPRFEPWVSDLCAYWLSAPVIRCEPAREPLHFSMPAIVATQDLARLDSVLTSASAQAAMPQHSPHSRVASTGRGAWAFEDNLAIAVQ